MRTWLSRAWAVVWPILRDGALMTTGAVVIALATRMFLIPNDVVSGGVTGIAFMVSSLLPIPVSMGVLMVAFNVPILLVAMRYLGGWRFALRTLYTIGLMSLTIDYAAPFVPTVTDDPLLYCLYGGVLAGIGGGLIFRARSSGGGFDMIARLVELRWGVPPGRSSLYLNALVFVGALALFGPEKIMYALLVSFVASQAVDALLNIGAGMNQVWVITANPVDVGATIMRELNRGVTVVSARGAYTGAERAMLLCVITRAEVPVLTHLVAATDATAFVVVGEAVSVYGKGFRALPI
jgi:uncharacterized membrane-anchored protein YitT (DUF2179 family)